MERHCRRLDEVDDLNHDEKHHFQVNRKYLMKINRGGYLGEGGYIAEKYFAKDFITGVHRRWTDLTKLQSRFPVVAPLNHAEKYPYIKSRNPED